MDELCRLDLRGGEIRELLRDLLPVLLVTQCFARVFLRIYVNFDFN